MRWANRPEIFWSLHLHLNSLRLFQYHSSLLAQLAHSRFVPDVYFPFVTSFHLTDSDAQQMVESTWQYSLSLSLERDFIPPSLPLYLHTTESKLNWVTSPSLFPFHLNFYCSTHILFRTLQRFPSGPFERVVILNWLRGMKPRKLMWTMRINLLLFLLFFSRIIGRKSPDPMGCPNRWVIPPFHPPSLSLTLLSTDANAMPTVSLAVLQFIWCANGNRWIVD